MVDEITLEQDVDEILGLVPAGAHALDDPQASAIEPEDEEDEGSEGDDGSDDDED